MIQHLAGELLALRIRHVGANPFGIQAGFVHAYETDGREVVVEGAQIMLGVGIEALFQELGDNIALHLQ